MVRIAPKVLRKLPLPLRLLMPPNNGNLEDAKMEYRWIQDHHGYHNHGQVMKSCRERNRFVPLQYILKTQPFGKLEIECRRGVLIPRWETEEWSTLFAERIDQFVDSRANDNELKVLDLCTGSACIALNIASLLHTRNIKILGLDVSLKAVNLANRNLRRNKHLLPAEIELEFGAVDIFFKEAEQHILEADVITMNPPYILQEDEQQISLSTRRYEPRSALVPSEAAGSGELFYARVIEILTNKHCRVHLLAFEIGSASQAERVKKMISNRLGWQSTIMQDSAGKSRCVLANKPA